MARKTLAALVDAEFAAPTPSPTPATPLGAEVADPGPSDVPVNGSSELTDSVSPLARRAVRRSSSGPKSQTPGVPISQASGDRNSQPPVLRDYGPPGVPKYLRLVRKEARLSAEQFDALTDVARRLNRRKPRGAGERITENTLIRIAVELLLSREGELAGTTEEELLASLR